MSAGRFNLLSMIRWPFAAPAAAKPAASGPTAPGELMRDAIYSESLTYSGADWPKYNPDILLGMKGWDIYRKMMTDEQIKAVTRFKRDAITARQFYFDTKPTRTEEVEDGEEAGEHGPLVDIGGTEKTGQEAGGERGRKPVQIPPGPGKAIPGKQVQQSRARFDASPALPPQAAGGGSSLDDGGSTPGAAPPESSEAGGAIPEADDPKGAEELELERRASVLEEGLRQMEGSFQDALNGIMTSMFTGFSMTEKVFKKFEFEGKTWIGPKYLRLKPFHSFRFHVDEYGNVEQAVQFWETNVETPISREKYIHHVHNPEFDEHYGQSELRDAYRAYFSKDIVLRFMNIFLERMAGGFVIVSPREGAQNPDSVTLAALKDLLSNLSAKNGILLPAGLEADIVYPGATDMYEKAVALYDKAIAKALMVPNLLGISEQGQTGSYSQSQTQLEAFLWTLDAEAGRLAETINKQLVRPLCDLNFGPGGPYPVFKFEPISDTVKMSLIKLWNELVKSKAVTSTDTDEAHIRDLLDFPEAGEPASAPPPVPQAPGLPGQPPASGNPSAPPAPGAAPPPDETIVGKGQMKSAREATFAKAIKRVDFAVIDNRGAQLSSTAGTKLTEVFKDAVDEIKSFVQQEDLFKDPGKIAEIKVSARLMTRARKIVEAALKGAWAVGADHARKELNRAKGSPRFAVDTLRLQEDAAQRFLESRSYTLTRDLADNLRKKVTTVLYNGIKGGWALEEILDRVEEEIGAGVLPHASTAIRTTVFEAINEARYELFASPEMGNFVEALEFSAILDGRTTDICEHMDGRQYGVNNPVWEHYSPPLHFNCRSLLIAITVEDTWTESDPPSIGPQDGFGG